MEGNSFAELHLYSYREKYLEASAPFRTHPVASCSGSRQFTVVLVFFAHSLRCCRPGPSAQQPVVCKKEPMFLVASKRFDISFLIVSLFYCSKMCLNVLKMY